VPPHDAFPRAPSGEGATLPPVRVVIADDHRLMLDGIRKALESDGGFEILGETQDGAHVLALVGKARPDLVLLDVRMPNMDGLACLDEIVRRYPDVKVVMLSASTSPDIIASALKRGASAYLAKSVDPSDLPSTLRQVMEGNVWSVTVAQGEAGAGGGRTLGLTERETAILQALARGLSNAEIAQELWVTQQTVKFHLTNIYRKLDAKNRTQAIRIAQQNGLVESPLLAGDE
jgi:DNA-binding NarL/FixJ family response regulator